MTMTHHQYTSCSLWTITLGINTSHHCNAPPKHCKQDSNKTTACTAHTPEIAQQAVTLTNATLQSHVKGTHDGNGKWGSQQSDSPDRAIAADNPRRVMAASVATKEEIEAATNRANDGSGPVMTTKQSTLQTLSNVHLVPRTWLHPW